MLNKNNVTLIIAIAALAALVCSSPAFAQAAGGAAAAETKIKTLFTSLGSILTAISIFVVTAGIMISGFQIVFGGKRPTDVMPILVGAVFVGIAAQVAAFLAGA